ncbi:MAG: hypothetical protein ACYTG0_04505 [Planctomycetota bacterium]|jgi:type II secretory pathway component PulJ
MITAPPENSACGGRRGGFTVVEVMLVSVLMGFLAVLVSSAWSGLGRSAADAGRRCRVVQEANLAAAALARDLGGVLPGEATGPKEHGRLVGRQAVAGPELQLCFDGNDDGQPDWAAPDTVVAYRVVADRLIRENVQTGSVFTVADHVDQLQLTELGDRINVALTFSFRDITRTYTIVAKDP